MSAAGRSLRHTLARSPFSLPPWARTIRTRLTLTYSALLFGITSLILAGVHLALSHTVQAAPLDPVTVKRFYKSADGTIGYKPGEQFQVADLASVQRAVNFSALQSLQHYSIIALAIMFVLSLAIGWWVAGRALRPVEAITRATQEISASDLSRRIEADGPKDELSTLADTIDGMLDRLDRAFQAERALVEDVSHELRNPVAVIQANVEAVLGSEESTLAERRAATGIVLQATSRMSRLLEDLLATARTRSEAFTDKNVDLASVVSDVALEYQALAAKRSLRIAARVNPGPVVYADPDALARAFGNLLSNAVRLAPENSTITVGVGSHRGWAWASVQDEGPGIPPDALDRVFDRFFRLEDDPTPATNRGSGLGLAISRQIVESHEGRLRAHSEGAGGTTFLIWLPDRAVSGGPTRGDSPPDNVPVAPTFR